MYKLIKKNSITAKSNDDNLDYHYKKGDVINQDVFEQLGKRHQAFFEKVEELKTEEAESDSTDESTSAKGKSAPKKGAPKTDPDAGKDTPPAPPTKE